MTVNPVASKANIQSAIATASRRTGVDFTYLIGQAQVESGMRADARATTSSATGLYQFIEQSWLGVVKQHGSQHGLGWAADSIRQTPGGRYVVSDGATRQAILNMRKDPNVASMMAAEHASDNKQTLEQALGREANGTDLYMAHFLGVGGARSFLSTMQSQPDRSGASMFPAAARANRNIFYTPNGQPRSLADIYTRFGSKLDRGAAAVGAAPQAAPQPHNPFSGLEPGMEVLLGNDAVGDDRRWVETTLANLNVISGGRGGTPLDPRFAGQSLASANIDELRSGTYRPTPETARLAYLMLANLGA